MSSFLRTGIIGLGGGMAYAYKHHNGDPDKMRRYGVRCGMTQVVMEAGALGFGVVSGAIEAASVGTVVLGGALVVTQIGCIGYMMSAATEKGVECYTKYISKPNPTENTLE